MAANVPIFWSSCPWLVSPTTSQGQSWWPAAYSRSDCRWDSRLGYINFISLCSGSFLITDSGEANCHATRPVLLKRSTWWGTEAFCLEPHEWVTLEVDPPDPFKLQMSVVQAINLTAAFWETLSQNYPVNATARFLTQKSHEIINIYCLWKRKYKNFHLPSTIVILLGMQ